MRAALTIVFAVVAAAAILLRIVSIAEPLGIDQSLWASAVRGLSHGQRLYQDVWEQRPPGIYWMYLAAFNVFGWTPAAIAWLDIAASAATTLLVYAIGTRLSSRLTGALAAALYAALTMPAWLYGHSGFLERSVCETFIAVAIALGAWGAAIVKDRSAIAASIVVGLCAGAAIVLKPNAGLYLPALFLWTLFYRTPATTPTAGILNAALAAGAATAVVPALAIGWLAQLGVLHEARIAVVDFNRFYVGEGFTAPAIALAFSKGVWLRMKTDPLWLAGAVGAAFAMWELARTRRLPPLAGLAVLWGGAAALVILVNGVRLFNSYFIQAFAPLALLSAWFFVERPSLKGAISVRRVAACATAAIALALLVQRGYAARVFESARADTQVLRGRISDVDYLDRFGGYDNQRGYSARANAELAAYVRDHTSPDDRIFLFGINGAGVYFAADRLTAHRFLRANFFVETAFPDPRFRLETVARELDERRPRYIIFERLNSPSAMGQAVDTLTGHPDVVRMLRAYRLETRIEDFSLYRLAE